MLKNLTIKATDQSLRPFDIHYVDPDPLIGDWGWAQRPFIAEIERQYNAGLPVRIIVLKARQLGISTATEAVLFLWAFLHRGSNSLVLSYEDSQAQELFQMTRTFWDTWPHALLYTLQYSNKRQLRWFETRSQVRVATAKNVGGSRGSTVNALHASEVAFWLNPKELWTGLNQTIPSRHRSIVVLESTANGVGNWFHEEWQAAQEGRSDFVPLFFAFYSHPAYRLRTTICTKLELSVDERELWRIMEKPQYINDHWTVPPLSESDAYEAIAWRRWAVINKTLGDVQRFMQEYPSHPEEAFLVTGKPLFAHQYLRWCFAEESGVTGRLFRNGVGRSVFTPDPSGPVTIFVPPNPRDDRTDRYFIGGDPSETVTGDPACMQVINRQTYEQVAVYHDQVNPIYFAQQMMLLGEFYNHCMVCPEVEGGGQSTIGYMQASGYDNIWIDKRPDRMRPGQAFGWSTNQNRKQWAIGELQHRIIDRSLLIHDRITYNQLTSFVEHDDGYWGNSNKSIHDDAVMALAICVTASKMEGPFVRHRAQMNPMVDLYNSELEFQNPEDELLSRLYESQGA